MAQFIRSETVGHALVVTLDRPQVLNSLHAPACQELSSVWDKFLENDDLWMAVVTGAGDKAFCAGHDLVDDFHHPMPASGWAGLSHRMDFNKPLIAAVNGLALGGGWEIALEADIVVSDPRAVFGLPEPKVGFAALGGGARMLPQQIPYHRAMGLLLTGDTLTANDALSWGLVNEISEEGRVMDTAMQWVQKLLKCAPMALRASKQIAREAHYPAATRTGLQSIELRLAEQLSQTSDTAEGLAAFAEKRRPDWTGT
jgi:enoyl-CoA hydratase/carnithine racemase